MHALESSQITKTYGHLSALQGVSLDIPKGSFLTLFGRNGAGKTTFLKIAATLTRPSGGNIRIHGFNTVEDPEKARYNLGFLSHNTYIYRDLTPKQNLLFFAKLYGITREKTDIDKLLERVGLARRKNEPVRSFSRGLQQRLGLARVILHSPSLLILDEPYTGLDAQAVEILNGILDETISDGRTVLMTTHDFQLGIRASTNVCIIDRGRIVYSGNPTDYATREAYDHYIRSGGNP